LTGELKRGDEMGGEEARRSTAVEVLGNLTDG